MIQLQCRDYYITVAAAAAAAAADDDDDDDDDAFYRPELYLFVRSPLTTSNDYTLPY